MRLLAGLLAALFVVGAILSFFTEILPRPQDMPTWVLVAFGVPLVLYFVIEFISPFAQIFTWASGGKRSRISNLKRDAGDVDSDPHQGEEK